ncbi:MAG TPA: PQQ-dependent sugar dehydrogenase [Gaiellaceae bacterium]
MPGLPRLVFLSASAAAALALGGSVARPAPPPYSFQRIATGFSSPVYVTSVPADPSTLYVVEQPGTIVTVRDGGVAGTFLDIRPLVHFEGEQGLLSMAFAPDYAQSGLFYVDYTDVNGDTRVVEYRAHDGVADPASARQLLFVDQPYPNHKGGQLELDRSGLLYVGMGDGGTNPASGPTSIGDPQNHAQNRTSPLGKLLRIDPRRPDAAWQTIGFGLRNPWRFSFDRLTGNLWIGDVGAATFEEVDFRPRASIGRPANYGWSRFEGRADYNSRIRLVRGPKVVFPTWQYQHTDPVGKIGNCGVIGGYVYRGSVVPAARGRYVFGDLCSGAIWSFKVGPKGRASRVTRLGARVPNLASFGEDASGELYAVSLDGALYALK